jgi:hypothetical protein
VLGKSSSTILASVNVRRQPGIFGEIFESLSIAEANPYLVVANRHSYEPVGRLEGLVVGKNRVRPPLGRGSDSPAR